MRVHVKPTGLHSRAMVRVSDALTRYAPEGVTIAEHAECADLIVLHVIGADAIEYARGLTDYGQMCAVIQYCLKTAGGAESFPVSVGKDWISLWQSAELVMSYYDLQSFADGHKFNFLLAPLGLDDAFLNRTYISSPSSRPFILTSGYVSGPGAEPIAEVWEAARRCMVDAVHIGPHTVEGMTEYPSNWDACEGIPDTELVELYARATWVSALRHVEGLEIMGAEGLACGTRPICFRQPAMYHWYGDHALYVKDQSGEPLIRELCEVMRRIPDPVTPKEYDQVTRKFNWERVCREFWRRVMASVGEVAA